MALRYIYNNFGFVAFEILLPLSLEYDLFASCELARKLFACKLVYVSTGHFQYISSVIIS